MSAYWRRYCPEALRTVDIETLCRVHNGGPLGATTNKRKTNVYWAKCQKAMEERSGL